MLEERRRAILSQAEGGFPAGYRRLAYIEATGTQYSSFPIASGVLDGDITFMARDNNAWLGYNTNTAISCRNDPYRGFVFNIFNYSGDYGTKIKISINTKYRAIFTGIGPTATLYCNDEIVGTATGSRNLNVSGTFFLFKHGSSISKGRIYDMPFSVGTTRYHFAPAMRLSDNEIGFLDIENNNFLENEGTGTYLYEEL